MKQADLYTRAELDLELVSLRASLAEAVGLLRSRPTYYPLAGKALATTADCARWNDNTDAFLARFDWAKGEGQ